jgi:hypothetical protein
MHGVIAGIDEDSLKFIKIMPKKLCGRLGGRSIGIVANQPLTGVLDVNSSKNLITRFCD